MHFNRLKIAGFKSFADPTELRIEDGLTGIVGPNGCGKSNLVEALRWVMGEHAPSTLRSKAMEEVIFAGTDRRPARNIAEVALVIDNRDRDAPGEFNDSDEIEILRRIERDMGSLYRINGREVRAKDVQRFFADAATGARSPSLIGQSRIAELIQAGPADRRIVLEEAAGISGLYSRRREAEQKLSHAEDNLARVAEVIADLEARIAQLKREARRAERYRELSRRIRLLEAWLLWCRLREAEAAGIAAREALTRGESVLAAAARRLAEAEKAALAADEAIQPLREEMDAARAALNRLLLERRTAEEERERLARESAELARQRRLLAEDVAHEEERLADARRSLARLSEEIARLDGRLPALAAERGKAEAAREAARAALEEVQRARDEAARRLAEARGRRAGLESDLLALARRIEAIEEDLADSGLERHAAELERLDAEIAERRAALADCEAELGRIAEAIAAADATLADQRERRKAREEELAAARARRVAEESEHAALADSLSRAQDREQPWLRISVPEGLEAAVAGALADLAHLPVVDDAGVLPEEPALRPLPPFGDAAEAPGGLVPLARLLPECPPPAARRLETVLLWEGPEEAGRLLALQRDLPPGWAVVTRSGLLLAADGRLGRPDAAAENARLLEARNRLKALEGRLADSRRAEDEARQALEAAAAAEAAAREEREALASRQRELETALREARNALQKAEAARVQLEARRKAEQTRLEALARERAELVARRESLEAERAALADAGGLETALAAAEEAVREAREAFDAADGELKAVQREAEDIARRRETLLAERKAWSERRDTATRRLENLKKRAEELAAQEAALARRPEEIADRLAELARLGEEAERSLRGIADRLSAAEAARREAQATLKTAQEEMATAREARARAEAEAEHAARRLEEVIHDISERFQMTAAQFRTRMAEREEDLPQDAAALEAELAEARARRERLGAVNLRAEIEMKDLAEQLEHLSGEKADLEAAIQRLRQAISSLNREGRVRLLEAFEAVNRHFGELFARLFEGGHAELALVESDDPLEAGLEIMARPPGKRLQSLSLLSGGEQTLTALALVFAVFLTNPAPICVLDEVDAPLDEANVERFCDLLDEMVRRTGTRFLIVTHNELTMARMHRLYGVTMREKGVSQLVSVDLERAERLLAAE
ncbi:MAG: chromosome partition protein Smc [Rhodothalassiaceae bacterium]|nr:MAG: chromosome partition protein Smc [Rhodothalassiaceae bacterium]